MQNCCKYCGDSMDIDRYEFLMESNRPIVCMGCSVEQRAVGFMDWDIRLLPVLLWFHLMQKKLFVFWIVPIGEQDEHKRYHLA